MLKEMQEALIAGKKAEGSLATGLSFAAGQTVTALYEVVPAPPAKPAVAETRPTKPHRTPDRDLTAVDPSTVLLAVRLRYQRPGGEAYWLLQVPWTDPGHSFDAASRDFRFSAAVAAFGLRHNIIICHDNAYSEVYFDGVRPPSFLQAKDAKKIGIEFHSLSKTYLMTGWRIGVTIGHADVIATLCMSRPPHPPSVARRKPRTGA